MQTLQLKLKDNELSQANGRQMRISWMTVSYRSVLQFSALIVCLIATAFYLIFPAAAQKVVNGSGSALSHLFNKAVPTAHAADGSVDSSVGQQAQARFVSLDGAIQVKHKGTGDWVSATYGTPLERGDVIQTGSEGMARVIFAGGTAYTMRPNSLIVIEENNIGSNAETKVAVEVQTGTVDLATGGFSQGSKSQVIVAGAVADLRPESSASILNDDQHDEHAVLVRRGGASITRQGESVELTRSDKVSFQAASAAMVKKQELLSPTLIAPANQFSLVRAAEGVDFTWENIENAKGYHLEISKDASFKKLIVQSYVYKTSTRIARLPEGTYYWSVRSVNANGTESAESERDKFALIKEAPQAKLALTVDDLIEHGSIVEITGKADVNARVVVNGEEVPVIDEEGRFHYFTTPLPQGQNQITITAENAHGMNRQVKTIFIQ